MMRHQQIGILVSSGAIASVLGLTTTVIAQIIPDSSLGVERSILTPNVQSDGGVIDRIDGGAIRGSNLFHSFQDFNVNTLQRVYFANPSGIETILGRVTGNRGSEIFGTLGVLGRANLFLINPNGIIFGRDARLDIPGSFFAGTTRSLVLENGYEFSTENPEAPPLLTINVRPGLGNWLTPVGAIANAGNLSVGQDLTLVGHNLDLQGQLQAGGNLTLQAADTLTVRGSITNPFIASAGSQLLLQGDRKLDISAAIPNSGLFAGGNLILRSANAVRGDTHYRTGGRFSVERLDGSTGNLTSQEDPVVLAVGDVNIGDYTGASLHILAGGSVSLGNVTIDSLGESETTINSSNANAIPGTTTAYSALSNVTLSDGTTALSINGDSQATLDVRAGIDWTQSPFSGIPAIATPTVLPDGAVSLQSAIPNGSSITAGNIAIAQPNGLVFLTNQYRPNSSLTGAITVDSINAANEAGGGSAIVDSRGGITTGFIDVSGGDISTFTLNGNGGNVNLRADGDIVLPFPSAIFSYGLIGGSITLASQSAIIQENAPPETPADALSVVESQTVGSGTGGDINFTAPTISLGGNVLSSLGGEGQSGNLIIRADSLTANQATLSTATFGFGDSGTVAIEAETIALNESFLGSVTFSPVGGNAGDVEVTTNSLVATNGGQVLSFTDGIGNTGNVTVTASDTISLTGISEATGSFSGFGSTVSPGSEGHGGTVKIKTGSLSLQDGAQIRSSTQGIGNAGGIEIDAEIGIVIDGGVLFTSPDFSELISIPSAILSEVLPGAEGQGNEIQITTGQLSVTNGGFISASTASAGDAGNIVITASESVSFDGAPGEPFDPSGAFVGTLEGATGQGGTLTINTPSLSVTNGAQLEAMTESTEDAGNITINASQSIFLSGTDTGLFSNTTPGSAGNGGSIIIDPERMEIRDGAAISVSSKGSGTGGSIEIRANQLILDNQALISAETASTNGGDITLVVPDLLLLRQGGRISTTAGTAGAGGDGGNITIDTDYVVAVSEENSDIAANAFSGRGGNVNVTARGVYGIEFRSQLTDLSDITASSEYGVSGTVTINNPEVDPSSGLVELPGNLTDASDQIVAGCPAAEGNSFTVTGRGGLPEDPTTTLLGQTIWRDLRNFSGESEAANAPVENVQGEKGDRSSSLVEATGWVRDEQGNVVLVAFATNEYKSRSLQCHDLSSLRYSSPK